MQKQQIDELISDLKELKDISDKQEYVVSAKMNTIYNKMLPILQEESQRLSGNIQVNSPQILILDYVPFRYSTEDIADSFTMQLNDELRKLVEQKYKIIDYGLVCKDRAYIKYTD